MCLLELFEGVSKQVVNLIHVLKWHFQRGFDETPLQGSVVSLSCQRIRGEKVCSINGIGNKVQLQLIFVIKLLTESSVKCVLGNGCINGVERGVGRGGRLE